MENEIFQQTSLWDYIYPKKVIDKPIRLIELFAGIGAQFKAIKQLTNKVESWKICEWAWNSYCHKRKEIKSCSMRQASPRR